jgi:polysaccharide deacetylase family protein (PEP-CTERM system associated)
MSEPAVLAQPVVNVMTIDVEDYYHVSAFDGLVSRDDWPAFESRVVASTSRILDLFAERGVNATFFVLGWVAERHPDLVRRIAANGHEVASHSYWHRLVYDLTPDQFREDLRRARGVIEDAIGRRVRGFRAPSYSVVERSLWALDVLADEGYEYDASIFPIRHDRYGIPSAPRQAHRLARTQNRLLEIPATAARVGSLALPVGGGYFRIFPYGVTSYAIRSLNRRERQPAIFYLHPWELDPEQPRLRPPLLTRLRHYRNLGKTEARLSGLLREFQFGSIERVFAAALGEGSAPLRGQP